jgi:hypothetical protein
LLSGRSGGSIKVIVLAVVAVAAAWVAAPWVAMARRGTIDSRTVAGWRTECIVPAPRRASDDEPAREWSA